jgi:pyruvate dehydrogenase E2 component (dihydrolipoamide acetyltransferase)
METGKIIKWLKQEGDRVQSGDILAEVETDKADVEMEAFGAGVLRKILVPAGSPAPVGGLIGVIAEPNEDIASVVAQAGGGAPTAVPPQPRREDPAARTPIVGPGGPDMAPRPPQPGSPPSRRVVAADG